jgi:predicted enzyme related to lactoylglutathione lyase
MRAELMLLVGDVRKSAAWYEKLLGARSDHGLEEFDRIVADGHVLLMLHRADASEHGAKREGRTRVGHGCVLWIYVSDLDVVYRRARRMKAKILAEPHENEQAGWREFTLRDPDGYSLGIIEE